MPPGAPKIQPAKIVTHIYDYLSRCQEEGLTGEVCLVIHFSQGGIGQVKVERKENLPFMKKP